MASHFLLFNVLCAVEGVTFLFPNKKVTKENGIGERSEKAPSPMYPTRRFAIRLPKMFRFSGVYKEKTCNILSC